MTDDDEDRLGFGIIAEKLSTSVLSGTCREGFVIGIEGRWGSGKSSILNLLCQRVEQTAASASVLRFDPWVVGDRDSMVASLMSDLARRVKDLGSDTGTLTPADALDLSNRIRRYGAQAGRGLATFAKLGGTLGVLPGGQIAAEGLEQLSTILDVKDPGSSLADEKEALVSDLKALKHRFVVVIDDIDRLEPSEAAEIVRLVRAVGDFPNIIYVLCYDKPVLAHSLEKALRLRDGSEFLQKVVQASFRVPLPEPFDLRRWLQDDLAELYALSTGRQIDEELSRRLAEMCDSHGGRLATPRDVVLVLNALRLLFPPIKADVDYVDMCWLQIIRLKQEPLYQWIEEYMGVFSALQDGASVGKKEHQRAEKRLLKMFPDYDDVDSDRSLWRLAEFIPGIEPFEQGEAGSRVYRKVGESALGELQAGRRLGSPDHYRWYFSFSRPAGSLDDRQYFSIVRRASDGKTLDAALLALVAKARPQGGSMYEVFLDRLARNTERLDTSTLQRLCVAIANVADEGKRNEPERGPFRADVVWRQSRNILAATVSKLDTQKRRVFLKRIFGETKSLGWLMADVIRHQQFAHGRVGDRVDEGRKFLSESELDEAVAAVVRRLASSRKDLVLNLPDLLSVLYGWLQSGFENEVRKWVHGATRADSDFLGFLWSVRGFTVSNKVHYPLNKRDLKNFMDYDLVLSRLGKLAATSSNPDHRKRAAELIKAAAIGKDGP